MVKYSHYFAGIALHFASAILIATEALGQSWPHLLHVCCKLIAFQVQPLLDPPPARTVYVQAQRRV